MAGIQVIGGVGPGADATYRAVRLDDQGNLMTRPAFPGDPIMVTVSNSESDWSYTAASNLTVNTAVEVQAAQAGKTLYVSSVQFLNSSLISTEVQIRSGTTVLWRGQAPASMSGMFQGYFARPLRGLLGANINVILLTVSSNTMMNVQGFSR